MSTVHAEKSTVDGCASQACECERMCVRVPRSLMTPLVSSYIHFHICAATTVGIAHGTSITARMTPRPLKLELTTSAMIRPRTNSNETVITVNLTVTMIASLKIESWMIPAGPK